MRARRSPASEEEPECSCTHPGHSRQRSMGAVISQPSVAFSSSIVSACLSLFELQVTFLEERYGMVPWHEREGYINPELLSKWQPLVLFVIWMGFVRHVGLLISNVQCLKIERFRNGIRKKSPTKPVFPCGDKWFELKSALPRLGVPSSAHHVSPTPSLYPSLRWGPAASSLCTFF